MTTHSEALAIVIEPPVVTVASSDHSGARDDLQLVSLWLGSKQSPLTRKQYAGDAARFLAFLAQRSLTLKAATAMDVAEWSRGVPGAVRTVARVISAVKSLFTFGHRLGYLGFNVAGIVQAPKIPNDLAQRIMQTGDVQTLLGSLRGRDRVLVRFLYFSGARLAEVCGLCWQHVQGRDGGTAQVTLHGKGGKTRHVLIPASVAAELAGLRKGADSDAPVFATRSGRALHPGNVRSMLAVASKKAGLGRISPHWLRHAYASHALDAGCPIHVVQQSLGHASLATTSRYVHARPTDSAGMYLKG